MKVAIYLRCSTAKSASKQTTDNQRLKLMEFLKTKEDWELVEVYEDYASGADRTRPNFVKMVREAKKGKFSCILCFSLSRLGRSLSHIVTTITDLKEHGVGVYAYSEQLSTLSSNPYNTIVLSVFLGLAEVQRDLIASAVKAGLDRAREEGKIFGRPRLKTDMELMLKLKRENKSLGEIARELGISKSSVFRKLKSVESFHNPTLNEAG